MLTSKKESQGQPIQAFARIRPFTKKEIESNAKECLDIHGRDITVQMLHGSRRYSFDKVFDAKSKQKDVYMTVINPIIDEVLQGYNCTVFAYGQTGTGKTFTMLGTPCPHIPYTQDSDAGIIPRTFGHLFDKFSTNPEVEFTIRVSYLELYNEILIDLLSADDKSLKIYEDSKNKGSVQIHGLEQVTIYDKQEVFNVLKRGAQKRQMAMTNMNENSSRSHTVFTITVHCKETTPEGEELVKTGKLNLVDLAGSENILRSGAVDKRAKEAGSINQSLLTLGRVIKGLVEKQQHIPYRESKLTRILQDSLGGKTKTTIIATVSPGTNNLEETISTMDYAYRARNITNRPEVNQRMCKKALIQRYLEEIDRLKRDVQAARTQEGIYLDPDNYNMMLEESEKQKDILLKSIEECSEFQSRIQELERLQEELQSVHLVTREELQLATISLKKNKDNVKKLRAERRIHQELIDKYDDAQTRLLEHTEILSGALEDYMKEHHALRNKVDNLYDGYHRNEQNSNKFLKKYDNNHEEVLNALEKFKKDVAKKSSTALHATELLTKKFDDHLAATIAATSISENRLNRSIKDLKTNIKQTTSEHCEFLKNEQKLSGDLQDVHKIINEHNKAAIYALDTVSNEFNNIQTQNKEIVKIFKEFLIVIQKKFIVDCGTEITEKLTEVTNTIDGLLNEVKEDMRYLVEENYDIDKAEKDQLAMIERMREAMVLNFSEIRSARGQKLKKSIEIEEKIDGIKRQNSSEHNILEQLQETNGKEQNESIEVVTKDLNEQDKLLNESYLRMGAGIVDVDANLKEAQCKNSTTNERIQTDHSKYEMEISKTLQSQNQLETFTMELLSGVAEETTRAKTDGSRHRSELAAGTEPIGRAVYGIGHDADAHLLNVTDALDHIRSSVHDFATGLVIARPKGDTPLRKQIRIQTEIPKKVSKEILQRFDDIDESVCESIEDVDNEPSELNRTEGSNG